MTLQPFGTIYEQMGGEPAVRRLVEVFYPKVKAHPDLGPLFPENIEPVMEKQFLFLTQYFGGPSLYTDQYGHPMMRARHMGFEITPRRAAAWLSCMEQTLKELGLPEALQAAMLARLTGTAYHFVNKTE